MICLLMVTSQQLEQFRTRLEQERLDLGKQIAELESPVQLEDAPGPDDETDEAREFNIHMGAAKALRARRADVETALLKIEHGTYGMCEKTGKEIPLEALEVNPALNLHPDVMKEINKGV